MSTHSVEQPQGRFNIRLRIHQDGTHSDLVHLLPHVSGHIFDLVAIIQSHCAGRPSDDGSSCDDHGRVSEALEHLQKRFVRKLMMLGCLSQNLEWKPDLKVNSVVPFSGRVKVVPTAIFPLPFPRYLFTEIVNYTPKMLYLVDNVSCNVQWLCRELDTLKSVDPFMAGLLDICHEVYVSGKRRLHDDLRGYITRADYLLHAERTNEPKSETPNHVGKEEYCRVCHYDFCLCKTQNASSNTVTTEVGPIEDCCPTSGISMKLVEVNTVSCAMAHISGLVSRAHTDSLKYAFSQACTTEINHNKLIDGFNTLALDNMPLGGIVDTLATAHRSYLNRYCNNSDTVSPCVLQVVTDDLANFFDVYAVADTLFDKHGITAKVVSITELSRWYREKRIFIRDSRGNTHSVQKKKDELQPGKLFVVEPSLLGAQNMTEVSVIYYRSCYSNDHMATDPDSWMVRLMFEYSDAVKIPSVPAQLAGSKRVQMLLCDPGAASVLSELDTNGNINTRRGDMSNSGVGTHSSYDMNVKLLENSLGIFRKVNVQQVDPSLGVNKKVVQEAIENPAKFVLKSQAEGGAELFVHDELAHILIEGIKTDPSRLSKYVLMRRIATPVQPAAFIKNTSEGRFILDVARSVTEVGIYGCAVYAGKHVLVEECSGYLARTKNESTAGGGVCSGSAAVSSLLLL
ncbi:glutathione synthetase, putative [Babesia ovis]|uniref:glutathione synthase n=1 Tax=Babesia ovis TaxID=5869 RepID=A0A9W5TBI3_BABOV|nr:glutathione synthetase, putative [Babesia ovis]